MLTPDPDTDELALTALFPDVTVDEARAASRLAAAVADDVERIAAADAHTNSTDPARTARAHRARRTVAPCELPS